MLPLFALAEDVRAGRVQVLLVDYAVEVAFGNSVYANSAPRKFLAPKIRVFGDYLVKAFSGDCPWEWP